MTLEDLGNIGELVAAIATLATLGYLAVQVGQARRQLKESNQQARSAFTVDLGKWSAEIQLRWFSPQGPNPTMMKALYTDERLTPEEQHEFFTQISIFLGVFMQSDQLLKRGLLDPEFEDTRRSIYMPYLQFPRVRSWWKRFGRDFYAHDEGAKILDEMVQEAEAREKGAGLD